MKPINRRTALKTLGIATTSAVATGLVGVTAFNTTKTQYSTPQSSLLAFEGVIQTGILTEPPEAVLLVALDVIAADRSGLTTVFKRLTARVRELMSGKLADAGQATPDFPPDNTGELGFDNLNEGQLSIMVGLGASIFQEKRFGLASRMPIALKPMPRDLAGDRLDANLLDGDICLQISSTHPLYNLHALRDILRSTKGYLSPRWVQAGFQRFSKEALPGQAKGRGLLGFKDGTSNLLTTDPELMKNLIWTGSEEPDWAQGGTYAAIRIIREQIERWDRLTLNQQEASIGRHKHSGAPLSHTEETFKPDFKSDPNGEANPLNSHIRKANPRLGEESDKRRMLRRGYLYFNGVDRSGLLDAGFLFMGFCRNVQEQFEFVKRNYMSNRNFPQYNTGVQDLDEYLFCVGGGYFFVPPGVKASDRFLADALLLG